MKRLLPFILIVALIAGCSSNGSDMEHALQLRQKLTSSNGCTFTAVVTADYVEQVHVFTLACTSNSAGDVNFEVLEPESISGITGTIASDGGKLTFDETVLAFEHLADGQFSPVCAAWLMMRALRSGYLSACGSDGDYTKLSVDDSYRDDAMHLEIWLDGAHLPVRAEILWQGRRILSLEVKEFKFL